MQGFCFDIEANGFLFEADRIWTIVAKDLVNPEKKIKLNPFKDPKAKEKFLEWTRGYDQRPYVVFHNGLGFDMFVLRCLMDIEFKVGKRNGDEIEGIPVQFVDTFYWSMYLHPDRVGHSIEAFGERLGLEKIDFRGASIEAGIIPSDAEDGAEFKQYSELMEIYCERDVDVNIKVFYSLLNEHKALYGEGAEIASQSFKCGQKSFFLMSCQEYAGWKFDIELAHEVKSRLEADMEEIRAEVEPQLPPRELKKGEQKDYTMPAKPFKKDGTYSANWLKWVEKHNGKDLGNGEWEFYGKKYSVEGGKMLDVTLPMEMANQDQMKDWFLSQGWSPSFWNYKRGADGKPMRDPVTRQLIPTSPKMQEQGKICPNLEAMEGEIVKKVVKWLSLRNRLSVLTGWMNHERLEYDGRLPGRRSGIAATHRQKHAVICNVPKASEKVLYGKEFRSLFTVEDGMLLAAADASGVEARVQGHYCVPMDTKALTRRGWKTFDELVEGEEILAYNPDTKMKEWTPLLEKCKFNAVETFTIENHRFKVRTTANHRWFVSKRNTTTGEYEDCVIETKNLNTTCNLIVNAPMTNFDGTKRGIFDGKYGVDWISRMISKGSHGIESFMEGFLIADGSYNNQNAYKGGNARELGKGRWKFTQNLGEHFETVLTCAYISHNGYLNVSYRDTPTNRMGTVTMNKKGFVSMQRMSIKSFGFEDVWCPRTRFGSWVMRQGDVITITGNTYRYDGGKTAEMLLIGDVHSHTVKRVYEGDPYIDSVDIMSPEFDKEDTKWKPYRDRAKNILYGTLYGCGAAKAASLAGFPESKGQQVIDAFWEANSGTKMLKDALERYWERTGKKKYLPAIDGRILHTRKKSALLNTIFQSCGGIIMDYACCFMDMWLGDIYFDELRRPYYLYKGKVVRRVIYYHDEMSFECEKEVAEEVAQMIVQAIVKAGELLKLKVPLAGEGKVGYNWCETH